MSFVLALFTVSCLTSVQGGTIICNGGTSCNSTQVDCDPDEPCTVECTTDSTACSNKVINCPLGQPCSVSCGGESPPVSSTCSGATINAADSSSLSLEATGSRSFEAAQVYCPLNDTCSLSGGSVPFAFLQVDIFAVNGFSFGHVDIACSGTNCINQATMYCLEDLATQCSINVTTPPKCRVPGIQICNDYVFVPVLTTEAPSVEPTMEPTLEPRFAHIFHTQTQTCTALLAG